MSKLLPFKETREGMFMHYSVLIRYGITAELIDKWLASSIDNCDNIAQLVLAMNNCYKEYVGGLSRA